MLQCSGKGLRSQARLDAQHTFLTANSCFRGCWDNYHQAAFQQHSVKESLGALSGSGMKSADVNGDQATIEPERFPDESGLPGETRRNARGSFDASCPL